MRRTYISPEYRTQKVFGSFNMMEESNFFGSKMLEIEDTISIANQNIIWYERPSGEQLDSSLESTLSPKTYTASEDKQNNHTLTRDPSQSNSQLQGNTIWNLEINLEKTLTNYIFAKLKGARTFQGISLEMTYSNDVNLAISEYIKNNVYRKYRLSSVQLWVAYKGLRNQANLRYNNSWSSEIISDTNRYTKFQSQTAFDSSSTKIIFSQLQSSSQFAFDYFFNLNFEKI